MTKQHTPFINLHTERRKVRVDKEDVTPLVVEWTFDMSGLERGDFAKLAYDTLVIRAQALYRAASRRAKEAERTFDHGPWITRTFDAKALCQGRKRGDPEKRMARATKMAEALTDEEFDRLAKARAARKSS